MTTRASRLVLGVLLSVLVGVLAGCGGDDSPETPRAKASAKAPEKELVKGTCWDNDQLPDVLDENAFDDWVEKYAGGDADLGDSMRDDAAFNKSVACTEPHSLELYNVVELAPKLTARIKEYADLLDQESALYRKIEDQVNDQCLAGTPYGKAQRKAGGLPVQLAPAINVDSGFNDAWDPFPADLWEKGQKKFVCTFEQEQPGTLSFADFTTRKAPVKARVCVNPPRKYVACTGKHNAELIAGMTLNTAIEKGQIDARKAVRNGRNGKYVAPSDAEYVKLDKICQTFLTSVSTRKGGVVGKAYPGSVQQWPSKTGDYVASCFAVDDVSDPPPPIKGTVFDKG
jgi:hypothetical protein